ncbi:MAG: phage tail tape measure protein [Vallitaleaceae bacterium]|nr:phage tail tape measure protein [Vallitaleaceae bacterium]
MAGNTVRSLGIGIAFQTDYGELQKANNQMDMLKTNVSQSSGLLGDLGAKARYAGQELNQAFKKSLATLERYKFELLGAFTAMSGAMFSIGKAGAEFDYQVTRTGLVAEATAEQVNKLSEEARKLGIETRYTASEAAEGQATLARMGFEVNEVIGALPGILDMAAASDMNLADASRIAAKSLNTMNYEAEETVRVADVLLKASTSAGANVAELGTAFTEVSGEAVELGWEIEGITAALGLLADRGEVGTRAGRRFRSVIQDLQTPTAQMNEEMKELGINLWEGEDNFKSLTGVVKEFETGLEGLSLKERQESLSNMFTKRGLAVFRKILGAGSEELIAFEKILQESGGTARMMAEEQMDTLIGSFKELKGSINVAAINMSLGFIPIVKNVVVNIKDMINVFNNLPPMTQKLVGWIALGTTTLVGFATAVAFLKRPVLAIGKMFGWLGGLVGLTLGKFVLLTAVFVGLYLAFEDVYLTMEKGYNGVLVPLFDKFLDFIGIGYDFVDIWNAVKKSFIDFLEGIGMVGTGLTNLFKSLGMIIYGFLTGSTELIKEGGSRIASALMDVSLGLFEIIIKMPYNLISGLSRGIEFLGRGLVFGFLDILKNIGIVLWSGLKSLVWGILDFLFNNRIKIPDFKLPEIPSLIPMLTEWFGSIKNWFSNFSFKEIVADWFNFDWTDFIPDWAESFIPGLDTNSDNVNSKSSINSSKTENGNIGYRSSIMGGTNPINRTTNKKNISQTRQDNEITINIDGSNRDNENLAIRIREELENSFKQVELAETGGI